MGEGIHLDLFVVVYHLDLHLGEVADLLPHRVQVALPVGQERVELSPVLFVECPMHSRVDVDHLARLIYLSPDQSCTKH